MRNIIGTYRAPKGHWVGDGFPVSQMFSYSNHGKHLNPFILLDRAGPADFPSSEGATRGVGEHPHRGFETVTIVYDGEVAHHDSTGQGGVIGKGDVQWMTAASGILHQEYHSDRFMREGGTLDMVQLWVNLPASAKSAAPGYQLLENNAIPAVALPNDAGTLRVIAGEYAGARGSARAAGNGCVGSAPESRKSHRTGGKSQPQRRTDRSARQYLCRQPRTTAHRRADDPGRH